METMAEWMLRVISDIIFLYSVDKLWHGVTTVTLYTSAASDWITVSDLSDPYNERDNASTDFTSPYTAFSEAP